MKRITFVQCDVFDVEYEICLLFWGWFVMIVKQCSYIGTGGRSVPETHRTTDRIFQILETVATQPQGMSFTEISEKTSTPKGSLSPLLNTLASQKYLRYEGATKTYYIGKNLYFLGRAFVNNNPLHQLLSLEVNQLATTVQSSVYLNALEGRHSKYLLMSDTFTKVKTVNTAGTLFPAYATASGKALLSTHARSELEALYPEGLEAVTPNTLPDITALIEQMEQYAKTGVFHEIEESTLFIRCISVPIEVHGKIVAAMSIAFHVLEGTPEKMEFLGQELKETKKIVQVLIEDHYDQWKHYI